MVNYWFGPDDELDAALILSGVVEAGAPGRYCFQTTYLNECVTEYYQHSGSWKLIWVHRNPHSVVYSMIHNWSRFALNELFRGCGAQYLSGREKRRFDRYGIWGLSRLKRACYSYNGKVSQLFELVQKLPEGRMMILDYEELVKSKESVLPRIYQHIGLTYRPEYAEKIHSRSLSKASRLSQREETMINELCLPVDQRVRALL